MKKNSASSLRMLTLSVFCLIVPQLSYSAGYELLEQSVVGVGQAFAGTSTGFGDGSEVFFNPAAMTKHKKSTTSIGIHGIVPHGEFSNDGSSYDAALGGFPLVGNEGGDAGSLELVPNAYLVTKLSEDLSFGLGVNSPFGLVSDYNTTWVGRYFAVKSELKTININPSLAYKVNDSFSIGAGVQTIYAKAKLSNAVDFGTIGVATLGLPLAGGLGLLPQQADGYADVSGHDWGVGGTFGALFTPNDKLQFGLNYRTKVDLDLRGNARFYVPDNARVLTSTGLFTNSDARASITLPETINFGTAYKVQDNWTILGDVTWIRWNRFDELRVKFDDSPQPDSVQEENWDNTWRIALGTKYDLCDNKWQLRGGVAWDQSPVPSDELRTPRIPDNDRYWLSVGAGYKFTEDLELNFSYAHIFIPDAETNLRGTTGSTLRGDWELGVDIASLQLVSRF